MIVIICENAINFDSMEEAKALIQEEADIGDRTNTKTLSKFQLFGKKQIVNPEHFEYCIDRSLTYNLAEELFQFGADIGQKVFFTPMAPKYVDWCERMGVEYYKVRYYDRANNDILSAILRTDKPCFISTDNRLIHHVPHWIPLWCSPKYPSTLEDYENANLYNFKGYSDHLGNVELLKKAIQEGNEYHEMHVCMTRKDCLEADWAITLNELEEVLTK